MVFLVDNMRVEEGGWSVKATLFANGDQGERGGGDSEELQTRVCILCSKVII